MLKGIDYSNVDSRRAFPLDGRTTWVESSVSKGYVVSKDNRVLGPGEYNPSLPTPHTKHVSAPSIGGSRGLGPSSVWSADPERKGTIIEERYGHGSVGQNSVISFDEASYYRTTSIFYSNIYHGTITRQNLRVQQFSMNTIVELDLIQIWDYSNEPSTTKHGVARPFGVSVTYPV